LPYETEGEELDVNFSSPANAGIVRYLEARAGWPRAVSVARAAASTSPGSLANPYYDLGTHPELDIEASSLDLDDIGEEWVFGGWFKGEEDWCLAAYRFAHEPA
jgi:hypothetical protein